MVSDRQQGTSLLKTCDSVPSYVYLLMYQCNTAGYIYLLIVLRQFVIIMTCQSMTELKAVQNICWAFLGYISKCNFMSLEIL